MTCFEPEACCQLISGMDFHKFYFDKCTKCSCFLLHYTILSALDFPLVILHTSLSLSLPPLPLIPTIVPTTPGVSVQQSMMTPKVHMLGENGACVAYIRLVQTINK